MRKPKNKKLRTVHMTNLAKILGLKVDFIAEKYCNGDIDSTEIEKYENKLKKNLLETLKYAKSDSVREIFFNYDPRGYFLKFNDSFIRNNNHEITTDWGGYGIICPEEV